MNSASDWELFERLVRRQGMGEIRTKVLLQNEADAVLRPSRKAARESERSAEIEAVVDTGAVMILLPQDLVERLGLPTIDRTIVSLADEQRIELDVAGGLRLTLLGRTMSTDCLIGPPRCEPLLGQLVLERLDLIVDARMRTLTVRPESPYLPHLKLKTAALLSRV